MSDIKITPMLVFTISFLSIFVILIGALPLLSPDILYSGKTYSQTFEVPEYFSSGDIENIKYFEEENITNAFPTDVAYFDFNPDVDIVLRLFWQNIQNNLVMQKREWHIGDWWLTYFWMHWEEQDHLYVYKNEIISNWNSQYNASVFYPVFSNNLKVKVWFTDTNTTRNNISLAFDEGEMHVSVGMGFDDITTSYNAFNLMGALIGFQTPEIFGASGTVAIVLNSILAIPLYISIAYLVFYFVTSIIPFIRGA